MEIVKEGQISRRTAYRYKAYFNEMINKCMIQICRTRDVLMIESRNINIIVDADGNRLVLINDIVFKGKRNVNWDEVKTYLEQYVGD